MQERCPEKPSKDIKAADEKAKGKQVLGEELAAHIYDFGRKAPYSHSPCPKASHQRSLLCSLHPYWGHPWTRTSPNEMSL